MLAHIHMKDLTLKTDIGTYGPKAVLPQYHKLDMRLRVRQEQVFIKTDQMHHVFDYDPLVLELQNTACAQHYETQEYLLSKLLVLCAQYSEITGVSLYLRKFPVSRDGGTLGVELTADQKELERLREIGLERAGNKA